MCIDLLRDRPEVLASGVTLPEFPELQKFMDSGVPLGNPSLAEEVKQTGNEELASILKWSEDVNEEIAKVVKKVPPFPWAQKSLEKIVESADAIVVSQTPAEALLREWEENDLVKYVHAIAGQELGKKSEHLKLAAAGKYPSDRILMIGDAPGDMKAAKDNDALFYPINPGKEDASWERLHSESFDKFLAGTYSGDYEQRVIEEFESLLPETPPWKK
jgi:phosphoglycolate phosphatase-like HAD superfamily hydrolase